MSLNHNNGFDSQEAWLEARKIGSSHAPIILGLAPRSWEINTPYKLWESIVFKKKSKQTFAMRRGQIREPEARDAFCKFMGIQVEPIFLTHPEHDFMTATFDGLSEDRKVGVEIKNVNADYHAMAKEGIVPEVYMPQVVHQMEVAGLDRMYYWSYNKAEGNGACVEVIRDAAYSEMLIEKEKAFYQLVLDKTAPALTDMDYEERGQEWISVAEELASLDAQIKPLEAREKELRGLLEQLSDGKNCIGGGYKFSTYFQKGNVDYAKVPELTGINLDEYRKAPIQKWRFSAIA